MGCWQNRNWLSRAHHSIRSPHHRRAKLGLPPAGIGQRKKAAAIPNSWPFKEQLLEELAQAKRHMEEEKERKKEEAVLRRKQALLGTDVAALVRQAEARGQAFDQQRQEQAASGDAAAGPSKCVDRLGTVQQGHSWVRPHRCAIPPPPHTHRDRLHPSIHPSQPNRPTGSCGTWGSSPGGPSSGTCGRWWRRPT